MLQKIRDRLSGWISVVIFSLVGGAFILFGVQYYFQQGSGGDANTAAKVNGTIISIHQLDQTVSMMQKRMGPSAMAMQGQLKAYALQNLVTQTALLTILQKEGFDIALPQVKAFVMQLPVFQEAGHFSNDKFEMMLARMGETPMGFFQRVQSQFIVQQAMQGLAAASFALPGEVNQLYALQHQSRAFGYFVVPMQSFLAAITISDADIKNYYAANAEKYKTPEKASFSYVLLSPAAIEKTVSVTDAEAKAYYQSHVASFTTPARFVVSQITVPVAPDASPADVAKAQAEIEKIAHQIALHQKPSVGSATMTLSTAAIPPELNTLLSGLKIGETAAPIHSQNGFTLLTLQKKEPATTHSFDAVKGQVISLLKHQRVSDILTKQSSTLTDLTYTNPNSLAQASEALHLPIQTSPLIARSGEKTGLFSTPAVLQAVFNPTVFQSNNNSGLIPLSDGSQLVVRVFKKVPSEAIPLATVHDEIKKALATQRATAKAGLLAYQLQQALMSGNDPEALAKQHHLHWQTVAFTTQDKKSSISPVILNAVFTTPLAAAQKNKLLGVQTGMLNATDYMVVGVSQVKNANPSSMNAVEMKKETEKLSALWSQLTENAFVESVMQSSKIVMPKDSQ